MTTRAPIIRTVEVPVEAPKPQPVKIEEPKPITPEVAPEPVKV